MGGGDEIEILTKPGSASAFTEKKTVRRPNLQLAQTGDRLNHNPN
jgi:hypothetical protein